MDPLYFDNAATSWPKPETTSAAMERFLRESGGSPGRSGHRLSIAAGRTVLEAREAVAALIGADDPLQIVFTKNATEALNIALRGFLRPGDHVITSSMEHNSVMRPLRQLEADGVALSVLPCSGRGELDPGTIQPAIQTRTRMMVLTPASNVTGTILPIAEAARIATTMESPSASTRPRRRAPCRSTFRSRASTFWPSPATSPSSAPRGRAGSTSRPDWRSSSAP